MYTYSFCNRADIYIQYYIRILGIIYMCVNMCSDDYMVSFASLMRMNPRTCMHAYIHRQIDRQTYIDIDGHRQTQIDIDRHRQTQIDTQIFRQIHRYIDTQIHPYMHTWMHTCIYTLSRQIFRYSCIDTHKCVYIQYIYIYTYIVHIDTLFQCIQTQPYIYIQIY